MTDYVFSPSYKFISAITNAQNAVVTCTEDHNFTDGEYVSFRVSKPFGMYEINEKTAKVLSHTSDSITVDLDTLQLNSFIYPVSGKTSPPMVVPAGSGILPDYYPPTVTLIDSFDNRPV